MPRHLSTTTQVDLGSIFSSSSRMAKVLPYDFWRGKWTSIEKLMGKFILPHPLGCISAFKSLKKNIYIYIYTHTYIYNGRSSKYNRLGWNCHHVVGKGQPASYRHTVLATSGLWCSSIHRTRTHVHSVSNI